MSKQMSVKPQGILSEPNKVGQFPIGAFQEAQNVAIRSFGLVEQVEQWSTSTSLGTVASGGVYALSTRKLTVFLTESTSDIWELRYFWRQESTGTVSTGLISGLSSLYIDSDCRTGMLLMRNRLIITSAAFCTVFDFIENEITGALDAVVGPRVAGVYQPLIWDRQVGLTAEADGGVLGPNKHMTATVVQRMVFADGYELQSAPAMLTDYANLSSTQTQIPNSWSIRSSLTISSVQIKNPLDVYRTREQSVGYDSINNKYLPIATGSSFYMSKSAERTGTFTTVVDGTLASALGEALVTNVAVSGATAIPRAPVSAKTCAEFRGHAFYANRLDPPSFTLLNPYFWGIIQQTAPTAIATYGIGIRRFTSCTATNGSPTVTGLVHTTGVVPGQWLTFTRTDNGATVGFGTVVSKTATTVTSTVNSSYSGSVTVLAEDVIELFSTSFPCGASATAFTNNVISGGVYDRLEITAVALERQDSIPGAGVYPGFAPTGGLSFRMRANGFPLEFRATNGANYAPNLPEITGTKLTIESTPQPNGYAWSENNEPENCPTSNYAFAGTGEIYKIIATRDCLWFFCSDGLFRLSGNGGSVGDGYDWALDPVDPNLRIHNPNCAVVHREYVYAYTNRGLVSISSEGIVRELSDGRLNPTSDNVSPKLKNEGWLVVDANAGADGTVAWMTVDVDNDEVWLRTPLSGDNPKRIWVYNTKTDTFCTRIPTLYNPREVPTFGIYSQTSNVIQTVFAGRSTIHLPTNGSFGSRNYEEAAFSPQPMYGTGQNSPHTLKHWQDIQFSFRTPQKVSGATVTLRGVGAVSTQVSRTIPQVTASPNQEDARVGFTIARNFPATSNAFTYFCFISATTAAGGPIALEATSVNYIDFTDQRGQR